MKFNFARADQLSEYLTAIEGRPEFAVAVKDGYTVINYLVQTTDTFEDPELANTKEERLKLIMRRDCRGIVFDTATGKVIAKRLHKFFNVNEKDETQQANLDWNEPHVILEKLDGSMITPLPLATGIRWGTKMGVTDVALPVEVFVSDNPQYVEAAQYAIVNHCTLIFEWCSRQQRIVVDYPTEALVLIAVRNNFTGEYMPYEEMHTVFGNTWGIPIVKAYAGTANSMEALIAETRDLIGAEGYVVRFESGHMVKVKAEDYVRLHRAKDMISFEKSVIDLIVNEKADDVKAFLQAEDLARFNKFEKEFWDGVTATATKLVELFNNTGQHFVRDRRTFAVEFVQKLDKKYHKFMYSMYEGKLPLELVVNSIKTSVGSQTKVDEARWMFNADWYYGGE